MAEARGTASARPERLGALAATARAVVEAVTRRAGWLDDTWEAYAAGNEADWRFDFSGTSEAVRAWAEALGNLGAWTGLVGKAFDDAGGRSSGGVHTVRESLVLDLLPCDARPVVDAAVTPDVDWGEPDAPPEWLEDLQLTGMAVGHAGSGLDAAEVAFVVGTGAEARWQAATPAILGRFATARGLSAFAGLFGVGSAGASGFAAGIEQWLADSGSYAFTDGEARARATARGVATGGAALGGGLLAAAGASWLCGPGAPVCAGVVVVGGGILTTALTDWGLDRLLGAPGPAEHDPERVVEEITGLQPGFLPRDVSDAEWDVLEAIDHAGETAGERDHEQRNRAILAGDLTPEVIASYDLPPAWVAERTG